MPGEISLVQAGLVPDSEAVRSGWEARVRPFLESAGLQIPGDQTNNHLNRTEHTPHLAVLLAELQSLPRMDPEAEW
jgi:1,2-phenylacetyl-CoA epoxidase catalytic subunit